MRNRFSGMEQHFHAGDVGFPFSVGEGMIVLGILFLTAFAAVGFLRLTVKKRGAKIVSQLFLYIFLDFSGTRLGYDL